jgi:uncharacterized protein involved in outer membrane biogenesis
MNQLSFLDELHSFNMSEKELFLRTRRWVSGLFVKPRLAMAFVCVVLVMWGTPLLLKRLLVQQLQHALKREVTVQAVHVHPLSLSFSVDGLSVKNPEGAELVGWQRLTVDVSATSFTQRALVLDALTLQSPRVSVVHLGQGRFDISDLLEPSNDSKALPPFVLHQVSIHDGRVSLEDRPFQRTHTVENFKLLLPLVSSLSGKNGVTLTPELSASVNGAPLLLTGALQPLADAPDGVLTLTVDGFDLSALQAYVPPTLPMRLVSGKLSADLKLQFNDVAGRMALLLNGSTQLQEVVLNDVRDRALLSFKNLALSLNPSDVLVGPLVLSSVSLDGLQAAVRIHTDGQVNWLAALPPAQSEQTQPTTASKAFSVQVDQFTLRAGSVNFSDASVKPVVQTRLTHMNAVLTNISTQPGAQADVTFKANLGSTAPLNVRARVQPLDVTAFLDAKLQASGVDLTRFSGYAQKYLGYPLEQGKLSIEASYRIKEKQLQAENHVLIDQLTLGEQVPSPHAIDAPVSLGVSLLKDRHGQIDIDLPVSGAVDAPEFSYGGLVVQTIGNVLVKVVTAPVRAIGSWVSSDEK